MMRNVEMTFIPKSGPPEVTQITEAAACAIRNSALMRVGNVRIQGIEGGVSIKDDQGETTLIVLVT